MPNRTNSYLNKLEILQYFIEESKEIKFRKRNWFCLHALDFDKGHESKVKTSRKKFRTHLNELLDEKLITRIISGDKRSKYFSITPLGICFLIKSEEFRDPLSIQRPNHKKIFHILETFATKYVKPYKSNVINNNLNCFVQIFERLVNEFVNEDELREEMPLVFSNFDDSRYTGIQFFVDLAFHSEIKIPISRFKFEEEIIEVTEFGNILKNDSNYYSLELSDEQFHHYFANLLIYITLYFHIKLDFDSIFKSQRNITKKNQRELVQEFEENNYPDDFLQILLFFNDQISQLLEKQNILVRELKSSLNIIQLK